MTIFRISQDDKYLVFNIPSQEVVDKLGRAHPFHINRSPIAYAQFWKQPLHINFLAGLDSKAQSIPDISSAGGRLFLKQKSFDLLKDLLLPHGEFLPVTFDAGSGYIFNPLKIAEDLDGLDQKLIIYDKNENLEHIGFKEDVLSEISIFRTKLDSYHGVFCNLALKAAIEEGQLTGVYFHSDFANPTGEPYGISH